MPLTRGAPLIVCAASLSSAPSYDESAGAALFPFSLGDEANDMFQFTVSGGQISLVSMTCSRAAPAQPASTPVPSVPHHTAVAPTPLPLASPDATSDATSDNRAIVLTPTGPTVQPQDPQATTTPSDSNTPSQGVPVGLSVSLVLLAVVLLVVHRKTPGGLRAAVQRLLGGEKEAQSRLARDVEELDPEDMEEADGEDDGDDGPLKRDERRPRRGRRGQL